MGRHLVSLLAIVAAAAGCGSDLAQPSPKPLPAVDMFSPLVSGEARSPRIANYRIDAHYDAATKQIKATETLRWKNTGTDSVPELQFHTYMNAFKNEQSVFMQESRGRHRGARAADSGWGWIEVSSIKIAETELRPTAKYVGPDETVLELPLPTPLAAGESLEVQIAFLVQLPEVFARTGFKGDFAMVGQWFPKIGVRVGEPFSERWHCEPFHLNSEFFADFGTYDVSLTVPTTHVVAATGVLVGADDTGNGMRTLHYRAADVHDFAWMIDPHMEVMSGTANTEAGQTEVRVYYRPAQREFAERHLASGIGAIEQFSELYYPYPWSLMSIIDPPSDAASGAGGMEYPTLVTTAGDVAAMREGIRFPEFVTIHEVGHNWFQGILASNEVDEAWLDEGVNEYADGVVMERLYGRTTSMIDWRGIVSDFYALRRAMAFPLADLPSPIATRSYEFADFSSYGAATYTKTALALRTLENVVGRDAFRAAMRSYTESFAFKHPSGKDLFATLEKSLAQDLDWFVKPAFHEIGAVDLRVRSLSCRRQLPPRGVFGEGDERTIVDDTEETEDTPHICDALIVNLGNVPVPVDVELVLEDGVRQRHRWEANETPNKQWHRIETITQSPVAEVLIDPDNLIALDDTPIHSGYRTEARSDASQRAASRIGFWTQTMMQVVGL
jgi:hypothetical protein